ncbi:MAG TPA: DUF4337 domain-containing protein [Chloroflexota bacterium]|nr:DUF4337 domain-containing protein [Chloroflexota bacterium]
MTNFEAWLHFAPMAHEIELETHDISEKIDALREEQEKSGPFGSFIQFTALTIGLMAVLAAVAAQEAASLSNEALLLSNQSILSQTKASDTWNEYQADGVKRRVFETQALVTAGNATQSQALAAQAKREADKQPELMKEAQSLESERDQQRNESESKNAVHETFSRSVGAFQIAIALASISALTRKRSLFYLGSGFGALGAALLGWGFAGGTL